VVNDIGTSPTPAATGRQGDDKPPTLPARSSRRSSGRAGEPAPTGLVTDADGAASIVEDALANLRTRDIVVTTQAWS